MTLYLMQFIQEVNIKLSEEQNILFGSSGSKPISNEQHLSNHNTSFTTIKTENSMFQISTNYVNKSHFTLFFNHICSKNNINFR